MLFSSLFKNDKQITLAKGRKRKLTVRDVVNNLDKLELTTANCTLIRDSSGNEKIEDYGQVDVYRVRDEQVFMFENGMAITTPTGMKLKGVSGNSSLAQIVSEDDGAAHHVDPDVLEEEETIDEDDSDDSEAVEAGENTEAPNEAREDEDDDPDLADGAAPPPKPRANDAYSDRPADRRESTVDDQETALGLGEVIRLRFFFRRIPYEIDCQILDRFNPVRYKSKDLTPRFGVGYHVRPLGDVRKRDQRRYVRYTHRIGFGHQRIRKEIQFHLFAQRTNLEIPERGVLSQTLSGSDFQVFPYGSQEVAEVKGAEHLENIVEFFIACMVNNPTERRNLYLSKQYLDRTNRSSLEGLGYYSVVGAQQATVLPKIFVKKQAKGKSVIERQLDAKSGGAMDSRKVRIIEDLQDRFQILTRQHKIIQQKRRKKSVVGNWENDNAIIGFSSSYGLGTSDPNATRYLTMPCEVTDMGVENITLKPTPYEDSRARDLEVREFVRQEDGIQVELLNFSVGGVQVRGGEAQEQDEAFLKYLVGDNYDNMDLMERIEALQKHAVLLHFYPVLNFVRSDIREYEPYLPFKIPVLARIARFRTSRNKENEDLVISSIGLEFIYNPDFFSYSRDIAQYDKWEQITPYTESANFIEVHKSLQLLFGFDRAKDEIFRSGHSAKEEKPAEESEDAAETAEKA
jgi:hypothetical protein